MVIRKKSLIARLFFRLNLNRKDFVTVTLFRNSSACNCALAAQLAASKAGQPEESAPLCHRQTLNGADSVTVKP